MSGSSELRFALLFWKDSSFANKDRNKCSDRNSENWVRYSEVRNPKTTKIRIRNPKKDSLAPLLMSSHLMRRSNLSCFLLQDTVFALKNRSPSFKNKWFQIFSLLEEIEMFENCKEYLTTPNECVHSKSSCT